MSPILSLILGWICNKAKAVSSFEFKYCCFFTMLNLIVILVFHSFCFISLARLSLVLLKLKGGVIHWQRDTRIAFGLSCQKKSNDQMRRLYTYAAWMNIHPYSCSNTNLSLQSGYLIFHAQPVFPGSNTWEFCVFSHFSILANKLKVLVLPFLASFMWVWHV